MWPLKRDSIHMKFSMTGQEKCDLLIQVTVWANLTVYQYGYSIIAILCSNEDFCRTKHKIELLLRFFQWDFGFVPTVWYLLFFC